MKLFAWDFHNTLEQGSIEAAYEVCKKVLEEFDIDRKITIDEIDMLFSRPFGAFFKYFSPSSTESEVGRMVDRAIELSIGTTGNYVIQTPNAAAVLKKIINKGDKNVIVSAMRKTSLPFYLEWTGLNGFFDDVATITPEEEIKGLDMAKKKGNDLRFFLEKYKPERIILIGDKETDIKAGKQVGAVTFLFSPKNKNADTKADFVITDLREVLKVYD